MYCSISDGIDWSLGSLSFPSHVTSGSTVTADLTWEVHTFGTTIVLPVSAPQAHTGFIVKLKNTTQQTDNGIVVGTFRVPYSRIIYATTS